MTPRPHRSLATWLALALAVAAGLVPSRGFVVCIEPDGCISVEVKVASGDCGGCGAHEEDVDPSLGTTLLDGAPAEDAPCACVDLAVPGDEAWPRLASRAELPTVDVAAVPACVANAAVRAARERPLRGPPRAVPRVLSTILHVQTVVLLV